MDTLIALAASALIILSTMAFIWPQLKKGADSEQNQKELWKLLWAGGLVCWIFAIVLTLMVGYMRDQVKAIDRNTEVRMKEINERYSRQ
jgi:Na+/proline symporter